MIDGDLSLITIGTRCIEPPVGAKQKEG